jgi:GT2 family glycosyltransferase
MTAPVWVVVINWNGSRRTARCLEFIRRLEYPALRVVVVDNGSTDGSVAELRLAFPEVAFRKLGWNRGFAAGANAGIREAREAGARYVWLVNNDADVEPRALSALVDLAESKPEVGAVGSVIVSPSDGQTVEVWGGGWVSCWLGRAAHLKAPFAARGHRYLVGASLLLRMEALDLLEPLDEGFFLYWEDVDLCVRLRSAGWCLAVAERSVVRHRAHGSLAASDPRFDFHYSVSAVRFFARHAAWPLVPIVIGAGARVAARVLRGEWRRACAVLHGTSVGLLSPRPRARPPARPSRAGQRPGPWRRFRRSSRARWRT